jgi:hypothetical protein
MIYGPTTTALHGVMLEKEANSGTMIFFYISIKVNFFLKKFDIFLLPSFSSVHEKNI